MKLIDTGKHSKDKICLKIHLDNKPISQTKKTITKLLANPSVWTLLDILRNASFMNKNAWSTELKKIAIFHFAMDLLYRILIAAFIRNEMIYVK